MTSLVFSRIASNRTRPLLVPSALRNANKTLLSTTSRLSSERREEPGRYSVSLRFVSPFDWLNSKIDFANLKSKWDPGLSERAFLSAAKQAVTHVSRCASRLEFDELVGLLNRKTLEQLETDLRSWNVNELSLLNMEVEDVTSTFPLQIRMQEIAHNKYCDINLTCFARRNASLDFPELCIRARFFRDYTEGRLPDWTLTKFKVNIE